MSEEPGVTTRCTVTYNGVKVPWSIRFDEPAGDLKPYEITNAGQAVLTAKSVYGNFWREYNRVSKHYVAERCRTSFSSHTARTPVTAVGTPRSPTARPGGSMFR
ncbi:hypothetical protein H0H10_02905 [Streptomyces sp. TRM S81-3]|uniref:Uncharacterized protein n=1 Tax=Streptomyces griseicoloratus TaxID=2752516 RepID=A0A926KWH9_9ACTN|nr:hypothetical protein [Streptomyces griseicoloratus]MBD0418127.1 hypothetical protein [Streptomyces griseicoloratus]